jgi:hypothetical protein
VMSVIRENSATLRGRPHGEYELFGPLGQA